MHAGTHVVERRRLASRPGEAAHICLRAQRQHLLLFGSQTDSPGMYGISRHQGRTYVLIRDLQESRSDHQEHIFGCLQGQNSQQELKGVDLSHNEFCKSSRRLHTHNTTPSTAR